MVVELLVTAEAEAEALVLLVLTFQATMVAPVALVVMCLQSSVNLLEQHM
jgi:hypothetical protein